jgi:predicted nucleic acid-binding protein
LIVDTSALLAYFVVRDRDHAAVESVIGATDETLIVSPYVVAELDYLLSARAGARAATAALNELAGGAWELADFGLDHLRSAVEVIERYADQDIGVTDASLVVLAKRHGTRTIATLDRRHFEVLRPLDGGRFTIVP